MFNIDSTKKSTVKIDLIEIVDNYKVIHYDDFPILYSGKNKFDNFILGSHLDEDDDKKIIYTLHTILTPQEYFQFVSGKKSYLELLQNSSEIHLIEKDFNFKITKADNIDISLMPREYLPTAESYYPLKEENYSLKYSISLKGKLADKSQALVENVSNILYGFKEFIDIVINKLPNIKISSETLLNPSTIGSFKINLELFLKNIDDQKNVFFDLIPFNKYISHYIKYITSDFFNDIEIFKNHDLPTSKELEDLFIITNDLYDNAHVSKPENYFEYFKENILKSANKFEIITEQIGEHFSSASIENIIDSNEILLAYINKEFYEEFQNKIEEIETVIIGKDIDEEFKKYNIYIYHLNTDTRAGNAFIKNIDNESQMSKPKIKINGSEGLEQTKYTESLYLNKWIEVKAKATKFGNKFKRLEIEFEDL